MLNERKLVMVVVEKAHFSSKTTRFTLTCQYPAVSARWHGCVYRSQDLRCFQIIA